MFMVKTGSEMRGTEWIIKRKRESDRRMIRWKHNNDKSEGPVEWEGYMHWRKKEKYKFWLNNLIHFSLTNFTIFRERERDNRKDFA